MRRRNLLVVQGGGPAQMLNATLAAIVKEARARGAFERIWGAHSGLKGLLNGEAFDLGRLTPGEIEKLRKTPGGSRLFARQAQGRGFGAAGEMPRPE